MKPNEIITSKILDALASGKVAPWQKPWSVEGMRNAISNKLYRGINVFILSYFGNDNYFLTYNQAKSLGGNVKKGTKGLPICFYKPFESTTQFDAKGKPKMVRILKYFTVFSVADCEGLNWTRPESARITFEPIECAEALLGKLEGCPISYGGDRACYSPALHCIQMPHKETFQSVPHYYATTFHEVGHALHMVTETEKLKASFGSEPYSKEELTAEIFASFCLNHCNLLSPDLFDNSASYLASWREKLSNDASLVISAASKAQRRFESLLGVLAEPIAPVAEVQEQGQRLVDVTPSPALLVALSRIR